MARIEQIIKEINGVETEIYPVAIHQSIVDESNNEALDVTLAKKATHGYSEGETPKTLKQVDDDKAAHGYTGAETVKTLKEVETLKASHGYDVEETPKTLKEVDDEVIQLAGEVSLLDAVHSDKIKDIENVISTMNPNQSAQLSVSGRKVVSLPKNAANGGMQVKLEGLTASQKITNGNFANGTTGWVAHSGAVLSVLNGKLKVALSSTAYGAARIDNVSIISGNKYYKAILLSHDSATPENVNFQLGANADISAIVANVNTLRSIIQTASTTGNISLYVGKYSQTTVFNIFIERVMLVDLTAIFGAGNEPDLATCNAIFSDYFEGVKSFVPTGRVRSVGKNLFNGKWRIGKIYIGGVLNNSTTTSVTELCRVNGATSYIFNWKDFLGNAIYQFDEERIQIPVGSSITGFGRTVTTEANCRYIALRLDTLTPSIQEVRLSKGLTSQPYEPYRETSLYLTAPELRSNGTVKDEIRKGANEYELVKRVGVGTSNGEIVINGDFGTAGSWTITGGTSIISDGTLKIVADDGVASYATQNKTITAGKIYRYSINVLGITGSIYIYIGGYLVKFIDATDGIGVYTGFFIPSANATYIRIAKGVGLATNAEIDNLSIIEYNPAEGVAMAGGEVVFGSSVHYTLANPVISPISYGGILNSAENCTVYHEPIIADAGVYGTNMPILLTDYPISSIEEIIKHEDGVDTYLDVTTAVIAPDGLSFTHPDLGSGDLVLFTYAFAKETTNGNITATFYDSNVVKIDTVTGKAYKITDVVTNGVLTRTLTEV